MFYSPNKENIIRILEWVRDGNFCIKNSQGVGVSTEVDSREILGDSKEILEKLIRVLGEAV